MPVSFTLMETMLLVKNYKKTIKLYSIHTQTKIKTLLLNSLACVAHSTNVLLPNLPGILGEGHLAKSLM